MNKSIIFKLKKLYYRYKKIKLSLNQPNNFLNYKKINKLSKEYIKLSSICLLFIKWKNIVKEIFSLKKLLNDPEIFELALDDLKKKKIKKKKIENKLKILLIPKDSNNKNGCFVEIRAATGGDEAAIFAGNLFRMYSRYSEIKSWKLKIINFHNSSKGGFKEIICEIIGNEVSKKLKFESGGHRVQRIPKTESQGRVHTSTCTVAVIPILKKEIKRNVIKPVDLKIDTFRSSGAGGQHVNTTDSAIRIKHIPTGIVAECQDERSQHKNKAKALSILSARIYAAEMIKKKAKNSFIRKNLLGSGERSDRIRTYNFPQNRITDHRINLTLYCLDSILQGKLDLLIDPIIQEYQSNLLCNIKE
ncbi:peptide chain release factor 1 [Buchnera aphidicola]|uniref:peptide chain release factor 1 n=1 Tax=Buchnera aphidicola TaxID=9 RepID=UPI0031B81E3A